MPAITRRSLMLTAAGRAVAASAGAPRLLKPKALALGDTVGLITPATYVVDPDSIQLAERTVAYLGLKPRFGRNVRKRSGYLAGTVEHRLEDLHAMFADPDVKAVLTIRGGYGSGHLLDRIDYDLIRRNPKIFAGYSDITAMHLAIHKHTGLVTFHAPVPLSAFSEYTLGHYRRALFETKPLGTLRNPAETNELRPRHTTRTIRPGRARGPLVGGNLSLVIATMGTPYEIETRGRILFLEDTGEQPYQIDRMLTNLRLAGKLKEAAGIVFGECNDCGPREYQPSFASTLSLGEVLDDILGSAGVPVFTGLTIGHTSDQLTLPIGVMASLNADDGSLTIEEAATV
ncbi:MAG TPA: LD-carboxypeptidase [Bryobacteraceae bacterium]|nr:LD-carboxypeptidase [Bryobacteraceae bacterium]